MDSKVKHTAVFIMLLLILMILGVVVYSNRYRKTTFFERRDCADGKRER